MADFNQNLSTIKNAVYGKDVRGAIYDALVYLSNNQASGGGGLSNSGFYTLPAASANTLGGIKTSSDFSISSDGKLSIANNKVVRKDGYEDSQILNFLHIDINKKIVPVPLLGNWFELETDKNNDIVGLNFSTNGRLRLLEFITNALASMDLPGGTTDTPGGYYTPEISQNSPESFTFNFTPSKSGLPAVESVHLSLPSGKNGSNGGYYTPKINITTNGFSIGFNPSRGDMPTINPVDITIPSAEQNGPVASLNSFFNVKTYGAKGDGITDDWNAVQAALDAARDAGGGVVYLPQAVYLINGSGGLVIYENTILYGEPEATLKAGSSRNNIIKNYVTNKSSNPTTDGGYSQASNIKVINITFDCNGKAYPNRGSNAIAFGHCQNIVVKNCKFTNCKVDDTNSAPHYMDMGGVKNLLIDCCVFDEVKSKTVWSDYIQLDCVIATSWGGSDDSWCYHDGTICRDITIQNCKFYGNTDSSYTPTIAIGCCHTYTSSYMPQRVIIKNNEFYNTWASSVDGSNILKVNRACIFVHAGAKHYTVTGNTWFDNKSYGDSTTTAVFINNQHRSNVVKNNTFYNTKYPIPYTSSFKALEYRSATGNTHIDVGTGADDNGDEEYGRIIDDVNYSSLSGWTGGSY